MSSKTTTIHINGGNLLSGSVRIVPNKNAILPAIAAAILTNETMAYRNVPDSPDVRNMFRTLKAMGAEVDMDTATVTICCENLNTPDVPSDYIADMQAGYLFVGPLLTRFGEASVPIASGCRLGYRGPEDHAEYLRKVGVHYHTDQQRAYFTLNEPIADDRIAIVGDSFVNPRTVTYQSPNVTATENVLMLLARTSRYTTEVSGIAQEPHVAQLLGLLSRMGAKVEGKGSTVSVTGADTLRGAEFVAEPDHVDYFGFAIMAAMTTSPSTGSDGILLEVPTSPLPAGIALMNEYLHDIGVRFIIDQKGVRVYKSPFHPIPSFPKAGKNMYKLNPGPWPAFPVDCLPSFIAYSTTNLDRISVTKVLNWMYTDGLTYIPTLKEMGANIVSYDDQRATIQGASDGRPYEHMTSTVTAPGVIEGVRAIISCALTGGRHTIKGVEYILRRNPHFFRILKDLGADITVEEEEISLA